MRLRARVEAIERRASPTGECACHGGKMELLLCRDPSVPPPPKTICPLCRRPRHRVMLDGTGLRDRSPPYEPAPSLPRPGTPSATCAGATSRTAG